MSLMKGAQSPADHLDATPSGPTTAAASRAVRKRAEVVKGRKGGKKCRKGGGVRRVRNGWERRREAF